MRPNNNQNNKNRQRSRNGGRKHVNPLSRNFESNGPDVKVRGNAAHVAEKYLQLARDAQSSGDSVMAENYLQHAEHYFRIVSSAQQAQSGIRPEGQNDDDFDDDMPEMNSRFSSPQPQQQPQYVASEGDEQPGESEQQPRQSQGEQRAPRQDGQSDGERPQRNERRNRRDRFRPEGEVQLPYPIVPAQAAADAAQPVAAAEPVQPAVVEAVPAPVAAAPAEQPAVEAEPSKPRERRPRRRRPAAGEADQAPADETDVGGLPAFLTAGTTNAAE